MELTEQRLTKDAFLNGEMFIHKNEKKILISSNVFRAEKTSILNTSIVSTINRDNVFILENYSNEDFTVSIKGLGVFNESTFKFNNYLIVK